MQKANRSFYIKLWLILFFYILLIGLFIQLVFLPFIAPAWHAGDGLLVGGDWVDYNQTALALVSEMETAGWSIWQLRPADQAPAGIAAAAYRLIGISKPWVLLPLNAASHATSAILLLLIIGAVTGWLKPTFWPILPFALFPTALLWNTQFHKDSFFILGFFMLLYGFLKLIEVNTNKSISTHIFHYLIIVLGSFLIWVVRPYGLDMLLYIGLLLTFVVSVYLFLSTKRKSTVLLQITLLWLAFISLFPLSMSAFQYRYIEVDYDEFEVLGESIVSHDETNVGIDSGNSDSPSSKSVESIDGSDTALQLPEPTWGTNWRKTSYLPEKLDELFYKVAVMRDHYRLSKPNASSNIDVHIQFTEAIIVVTYIPRALQIGLLAPFPSHWFEQGSSAATTMMRRATILEMLVIYFSLAALPLTWWYWRKRPAFYIAFAFPAGMILTYALVVANVGTLHRMRYGFLMVLVALGLAGIVELLNSKKAEQHLKLTCSKGNDDNSQ